MKWFLPGYPEIFETNVAGSPSSTTMFLGPSTIDGALIGSMGCGGSRVSGGPTGTKQKHTLSNLDVHFQSTWFKEVNLVKGHNSWNQWYVCISLPSM